MHVDRAQVVDRHQLDRLAAQDARALERAPLQHHLQEARVVARGGEEAGAAGEALARPLDVRALAGHAARGGGPLEVAGLRGVDGGQPRRLVGREIEMRVAHLQRLEDA